MQAKMMLFYQLRQQGFDRGSMAKTLGTQQYTQGACEWYAQRTRHLATFSFID